MKHHGGFNRLMDLPDVNVNEVDFGADKVVVSVALARKKLICPECGFIHHGRPL